MASPSPKQCLHAAGSEQFAENVKGLAAIQQVTRGRPWPPGGPWMPYPELIGVRYLGLMD